MTKGNASSRRDFLKQALVGIYMAGSARQGFASSPLAETGQLTKLAPKLWVYRGPINIGILQDGDKTLLIDCGAGSVRKVLSHLGISTVERILFTHHHRDQACAAQLFSAQGTRLCVPQSERDYFDKVSAYWNNPKRRWHLYNLHPHHLMLAESVPVDSVLQEGACFSWGSAEITVLATPGHTDGSLSYQIDIASQRFIFSGDVIHSEGKIWDVHSLQKGTQTTDYHGFLGAREELIQSLTKIKQQNPAALVPSHGQIMNQPSLAIDVLVAKLNLCYDRYVAISALRHYFPKLFTAFADRKDHMQIRPGMASPKCLKHIGTSWILVSKTKAALVMDCGSQRVIQSLQDDIQQGNVTSVEGLWVTHYHDDHVDAIPQFQATFDCPCITDTAVAEVISDPLAWRLPCVSPNRARVDRATQDGETWTWHEYKLTAYNFPGQTLYHAGLLVEKEDLRMLFVGDSFTPGGIDDYCSSNRNWLGCDRGFDRCIALIEKLKPTHIFNCHVNEAFDFTPAQCRFMRANLAERERLFGDLVPWDHANYGMDEPWVRCFPYEQEIRAGSKVEFDVIITNHSSVSQSAEVRPVWPRIWEFDNGTGSRRDIPYKSDGALPLSGKIPQSVTPGRYVIPIDLRYDGRTLPQFTEGIVVVTA
jgi:glyoxylase-like metal-dependent hydrolase (beta-lactamase superfamily II)